MSIVQYMNNNVNEDNLNILRRIVKNPKASQRELAENLGFSLGKLNYCLQKLKEHGLIRIKRFNDSENKIGYMYALTPRGMRERTKLTINYMKQKMIEYDELKKELNQKK